MHPKRGGLPLPPQVKHQFFALIHQGYNQSDAARASGVSIAQGCRWFHQAGGVIIHEPPKVSDRFLSLEDRITIADGIRAHHSKPRIAGAIGKSAATVYREVQRNSRPGGQYDPYYAHNQAYLARRRERAPKLAAHSELRGQVSQMLGAGWSPRQIAAHLRQAHPDAWHQRVCAESIYQAYYAGVLGAKKKPKLRSGRRLRKPRGRAKRGHTGPIAHMTSIHQRPPAAAERSEPGHWEGDLILGRDNRSQIGTLVCRQTRYLKLLHLPAGHTAEQVRDALITQFATLPPTILRTLTWDQGGEMALHQDFTHQTGIPVYFCDPHAPWQRPTNENTNGLLRQYFPKSTDLSIHTRADLDHIEHLLNTRPRDILGWATPEERMAPWIPNQPITTTRNH